MHKTRLLIIGAGGHGRSVAEAAELSGAFEVVGFLDDALPVGKTVLMGELVPKVWTPKTKELGSTPSAFDHSGSTSLTAS